MKWQEIINFIRIHMLQLKSSRDIAVFLKAIKVRNPTLFFLSHLPYLLRPPNEARDPTCL